MPQQRKVLSSFRFSRISMRRFRGAWKSRQRYGTTFAMNDNPSDLRLTSHASNRSGEPETEQVWQEPVDRLLAVLKTKATGLTTAEAQSRLATYGPNDAATVKRSPLWLQFLARFRNPLIIILLIASAVSAATGDVASFVIIFCIVMLSIIFDFVQEVRAQNAVEALRRSVAVQATVRRDGASVSVPIDQLVPGDIVELIAGDLVPADCAAAGKPRSLRQPGAADRRALSGREAGRRCGLRRRKPGRRLQRRVRRHLRHQRHRDHPDLPNRRQDGARPPRDQPGGEAAGHRLRRRHSPLRHADHALHRADGAVRAGREHRLRTGRCWNR